MERLTPAFSSSAITSLMAGSHTGAKHGTVGSSKAMVTFQPGLAVFDDLLVVPAGLLAITVEIGHVPQAQMDPAPVEGTARAEAKCLRELLLRRPGLSKAEETPTDACGVKGLALVGCGSCSYF